MTLQRRNRQRGKASERALAEILGWLRYGVMGGEDLIDPSGEWSGESKSVQKCVVRKWYEQAARNALKSKRKGAKRPVVFIHFKGTQHEVSDLVLISLSDFQRLTGNFQKE
jgi:hypothetical protein